MGQTASSAVKGVGSLLSYPRKLWKRHPHDPGEDSTTSSNGQNFAGLIMGATIFVHKRKSVQFEDEDGDVADEFYEQTRESSGAITMKRKTSHLTPVGEEDLPIPRLRSDLPVVLYEIT